MEKLIKRTIELLTGVKVHAGKSAIKGNISGGTRDGSGKDWRKANGSSY